MKNVVSASSFADAAQDRIEENPQQDPYVCEFCKKGFKRETTFKKHQCREKKVREELSSINGKRAFILYNKWMKLNHREQQDISVFANSRYFTSFIQFAEYVQQVNLEFVERFIEIMKLHRLEPSSWRSEEAYELYSNFLKNRTPQDQIEDTVFTLTRIKERNGLADFRQIFQKIGLFRILSLIETGHLSYWCLLLSGEFSAYVESLPEEQLEEFTVVFDAELWNTRISENPDIANEYREALKELGL